MDTKDLFDQGLETRKAVLGEDYVQNSINNADEFGMKLQEFITTHAWGAIWGREGLPLKTRSMINIAMLAALGRPHEFRLHLEGAINNGVSKDEIAEILIQVGSSLGMVSAVVELMDPVAAFLSVVFIEILIVLRRNFRFERKKKFLVLLLDSLRLGLFYGFFTESLKLL